MDKHIVYVSTDVTESRRRMTYSIHVTWTENLADYLFFFPSLNDAGIRSSDPPSDTIAVTSTDSTVFTSSDPTVATPSGQTVATPDLSDNTFSMNLAIVLLAVVAGTCLLAFVTVLTVLIMRSRKARSRRGMVVGLNATV
ncbi:hypothetical protein PoB_001817600 [Plakobranchus ocellatus]|uniref:Uncharacterized protein n=1 Tax=Plakobranchus ocellatus TaxID=259542 RepID=A0AAV3YX37_9GAST|nr:hypothetical protein PoB_001817600 [Plakobranchus ocellatus]